MDIPHMLESASNIGFREKLSYPLLMRNSIIMVGWYYYDSRKVFGKSKLDSVVVALRNTTSSSYLFSWVYFRKREEFLKKQEQPHPSKYRDPDSIDEPAR